MVKLATNPNRNGNTTQLIIDNDKKTIKSGYSLFIFADVTTTQTQLKAIKTAFLNDGYKEL